MKLQARGIGRTRTQLLVSRPSQRDVESAHCMGVVFDLAEAHQVQAGHMDDLPPARAP